MKFHLSIVLDKDGYKRQDLYSCKTLRELDEYIRKFKDHHEVREKYQEDISEFLLDNMEYIKENEKKNKRVNNGRICIIYEGKNNTLRMFALLYQNDGFIMEKKTSLRKIRSELKNNDKIKELLNKKRYLLSQNEVDLLKGYFNLPSRYKNKEVFINDFIARLDNLSEEHLYMYLRSLMNIFGLLREKRTIKTKYGEINNIDINMPRETVLSHDPIVDDCKDEIFISLYSTSEIELRRNSIVDDCKDEIFIELYRVGDFERLYQIYDLEDVERYIKRPK